MLLTMLECEQELMTDGTLVKSCVDVVTSSTTTLPATGGAELVLSVVALGFLLVGVHAVWVSRRG